MHTTTEKRVCQAVLGRSFGSSLCRSSAPPNHGDQGLKTAWQLAWNTGDIKKGWIAALVSAAILLLPGIPITYVGVRLFGERHAECTNFIYGVMTLLVGSGICLAATTVLVLFFIFGLEAKAKEAASSRVEPGPSFDRQGNDTHCKECGSELVGPRGPCRKCDNVQKRPCASCGSYILPNDKTCPYCGAELK